MTRLVSLALPGHKPSRLPDWLSTMPKRGRRAGAVPSFLGRLSTVVSSDNSILATAHGFLMPACSDDQPASIPPGQGWLHMEMGQAFGSRPRSFGSSSTTAGLEDSVDSTIGSSSLGSLILRNHREAALLHSVHFIHELVRWSSETGLPSQCYYIVS